jgi:WD40 repeat protein
MIRSLVIGLSLVTGTARADDDYREFKGHDGPVRAVQFTPDGTKLVSGGGYPFGDGTVRVWDVKTGKELLQFKCHQGNCDHLVLDKEAKRVLTASGDKTAKLWDLATGKRLAAFVGHDLYVTGIAFSPDGKTVATGAADKTVRLWDAATGKETFRYDGHRGAVKAVAYVDDTTIVSGSLEDGAVKIWDPATGKEKSTITPDFGRVSDFVLTPDKKEVVVISGTRSARFDLQSGKEVKKYAFGATCVAVSDDGKRLLTGNAKGEMMLWDLQSGRKLAQYQAHIGSTFGVAFAPGGKLAASGGGGGPTVDGKPTKGEDFMVRVWTLDE